MKTPTAVVARACSDLAMSYDLINERSLVVLAITDATFQSPHVDESRCIKKRSSSSQYSKSGQHEPRKDRKSIRVKYVCISLKTIKVR